MSNMLGRKVQWGENIVQRSDGTWQTDWVMEILDHEVMPEHVGDLRQHLRRLVASNPAASALVDLAEVGKADAHSRTHAIAEALTQSNAPFVKALVASRNLRSNKG